MGLRIKQGHGRKYGAKSLNSAETEINTVCKAVKIELSFANVVYLRCTSEHLHIQPGKTTSAKLLLYHGNTVQCLVCAQDS